MTIAELNSLERAPFVSAIGWVFEHSPWVAERAWNARPFADVEALHRAMVEQVERALPEEQLALLRAHPDLGTRARVSDASSTEQAGAGLDQLTPEEFERLRALNETYRDKFGFPFLFAVKRQYQARHSGRYGAACAVVAATKSIWWRSIRFTGSRDSGWKIR